MGKSKSIIPQRWEFLSPLQPEKTQWLPGVDFSKLLHDMVAAEVTHVKVTVEQIIDWNKAPMRRFFHGIQLPAYEKQYKAAGFHPEENRHEYTKDEIKTFLKARTLGFEHNAAWAKWGVILTLDKPITDIYAFTALWDRNLSVDTPVQIKSSESVSPTEYWKMLKSNNKYFFDTFHTMYDIKDFPLEPKG